MKDRQHKLVVCKQVLCMSGVFCQEVHVHAVTEDAAVLETRLICKIKRLILHLLQWIEIPCKHWQHGYSDILCAAE